MSSIPIDFAIPYSTKVKDRTLNRALKTLQCASIYAATEILKHTVIDILRLKDIRVFFVTDLAMSANISILIDALRKLISKRYGGEVHVLDIHNVFNSVDKAIKKGRISTYALAGISRSFGSYGIKKSSDLRIGAGISLIHTGICPGFSTEHSTEETVSIEGTLSRYIAELIAYHRRNREARICDIYSRILRRSGI